MDFERWQNPNDKRPRDGGPYVAGAILKINITQKLFAAFTAKIKAHTIPHCCAGWRQPASGIVAFEERDKRSPFPSRGSAEEPKDADHSTSHRLSATIGKAARPRLEMRVRRTWHCWSDDVWPANQLQPKERLSRYEQIRCIRENCESGWLYNEWEKKNESCLIIANGEIWMFAILREMRTDPLQVIRAIPALQSNTALQTNRSLTLHFPSLISCSNHL